MPTVSNATKRKYLSEVLAGYDKMQDEFAVNRCWVTIDAEGSGDVEPFGTLMEWSNSDSAFKPLDDRTEWAADTATSVGDIVIPTTWDGFEYVAVAVTGDTQTGATEPTWVTTDGANTTDDAVTWKARIPFGRDVTSPLPNQASICVTVGDYAGKGCDHGDVTLSSTSVNMTGLFRDAAVKSSGLEVGSLDTNLIQAFKDALESNGISIVESLTDVTPTFRS